MRVGTSCLRWFKIFIAKDHPHACGDKVESNRTAGKTTGSSPCVWGQAAVAPQKLCLSGIIPMRVGTSFAL